MLLGGWGGLLDGEEDGSFSSFGSRLPHWPYPKP